MQTIEPKRRFLQDIRAMPSFIFGRQILLISALTVLLALSLHKITAVQIQAISHNPGQTRHHLKIFLKVVFWVKLTGATAALSILSVISLRWAIYTRKIPASLSTAQLLTLLEERISDAAFLTWALAGLSLLFTVLMIFILPHRHSWLFTPAKLILWVGYASAIPVLITYFFKIGAEPTPKPCLNDNSKLP